MEKDQTATPSTQVDNTQDQDALKAEEKKESALLASINKLGTNSYYYAHTPKNFNTEGAEVFKGDGLIYGGDPVLLGQREAVKKEQPQVAKKITKYSWIDEDAKVKIYIELDQFQGAVTDAMMEVKFEEQSCQVKIVDENCQSHVLNLPKLYEKIEPEKSSHRIRSNKLIITLDKWLETSWRELIRAK